MIGGAPPSNQDFGPTVIAMAKITINARITFIGVPPGF
jgi:hypothetical protein